MTHLTCDMTHVVRVIHFNKKTNIKGKNNGASLDLSENFWTND